MTTRKKRAATGRKTRQPKSHDADVALSPAATPETPSAVVNVVTLDNTVPGGFRLVPKASDYARSKH